MKSSILFLKINPRKIAFFKFILEGYDHLAILTILNGKTGLIKLHFHPKNYSFIKNILEELQQKISIEFFSL